jgi:subfamily B ATP-binding cassette protein MsbA
MPDPAPDSTSAAAPTTNGAAAPAPAPSAPADPATPKKKGKPEKLSVLQAINDGNAGYKKLWPFVDKYRWRFVASLLFGGGSAILTAAQVQVLHLVTHRSFHEGGDVAKGAVTVHGSFLDLNFHDAVLPMVGPTLWHVLLICSLLPLVIIARCFCDYMENYYMTWVSLRVLHDLRVKIFNHILGQSFDFFNRSKQGSLISRISNDTRSAQLAITAVTDDIVTQPLTVVAVVCVMLHTDWRFTLYSLCLLPLCLLPIGFFGRKVRKIGRQDETSNAELMVILHEALAGIRLVKSLNREPHEEKRFTASSHNMITISMRVRKAMAIVGPIIESLGGLGVMAGMVYVFFSHMPFSTFTAMLASILILYTPLKKLSKVHVSIQKALGATTKIFELLDEKPTIGDKPDALVLKKCRGEIEFDGVTFTYDLKRPPALRRVNLHIEPGKSYALVGVSGAGKSTMFSLMLRFYDPYCGVIRVDGHDIRTVTQESLRRNIGMVSQDTFLFHETIMENIRYGRLDATDEEIYEAARQAFAHDFILAQPYGYETIIGDKGCLISGGQQQRLAIARALLKNAPILLLDEATSALDSESEHEIQAALDRLATGRTVIAIAHRLSTILKADQIVVMHQGEIKEVGRHEELLESSVLYRRFYDLQFNQHEGGAPVPFEAVGALAS